MFAGTERDKEHAMKPVTHICRFASCVALLLIIDGTSTFAQEGKLILRIKPQQAYVFVDGRAIGETSKQHSLRLSEGDHKIDLANYGYIPVTRTITITAGKTVDLEVALTPISEKVAGPFGAMTIEGAAHDAVLLNGKTPLFFVGHGDEFDHEWWWKQELVVPPGNYQVTVKREDKEIWSGPVDVAADKRLVLDIPKGVRKTVEWPRGQKFSSIPRFTAGSASATVAVAKPQAELSLSTAQINCGDASQLKWTSSDAPQVEITAIGTVAASGAQAVQPNQTTTYQLTASGPGGIVTSSATVHVNAAIEAGLGLSPAEIRYRRIGDKVVEEGSTALNWTAANASTISIDLLGTVDSKGSHTLQVAPRRTDPGTIDETVTYTLNASNACGGSQTKTATLHITGSIENEPARPAEEPRLSLRSVFFPTDQPETLHSEAALLPSEQDELRSVADAFKKYLAVKPDATLILAGHADRRGPQAYNQLLSERRAQLAKKFLIGQGVPETNLETRSYGKEKNLSADEVRQLVDQNADLSAEERQKLLQKFPTIVLAYNRRVDINLTPAGQESVLQYPYQAENFASLIDRNGPKRGPGSVTGALRDLK
jgi:peptidoglycan-associated lipoprotein